MFRRAHEHNGSAIVEVYQNCNVFNDAAFGALTKRDARDAMLIGLTHGEPVIFGVDRERGIQMINGVATIVEVAAVGLDAIHVHDEQAPDPAVAFALSRVADDRESPTPIGVFRAVQHEEYGDAVSAQIARANADQGPGNLHDLLRSLPTWDVD